MQHDEAAILAATFATVRALSADLLVRYAKTGAVRAEPASVKTLPFLQQMAHVLLSGEEVTIGFKTHFMFDEVASLASRLHASPSPDQCVDVMKEFCNIVAGAVKALFEDAGLTLGQSLPFSIQGYNEILYPDGQGRRNLDAWMLVADQGRITCSVTAIVSGAAVLERLAAVKYTGQAHPNAPAIELF